MLNQITTVVECLLSSIFIQTRLAEIQDATHKDNDHLEKKEIAVAKGIETKDEDSDKAKRAASHLIAFFSKNKDREKEHTREKEKEKSKSKDKDKGRSTPPPGKQASEAKSTHGSKLERKGSTGSTASQKESKSWRKSLGILGGSFKHDKEEKHKKNADHRSSYPADMSMKNSQGLPAKQEGNTVKTVRESREEKSNKKQPERRSSNPTAEVQVKNSQVALGKQDINSLKTLKENKEEKSNKKHPERRTSPPTEELQKTVKNDKEEKSSKKQNERQNERQSLNPSAESQTRNSQIGSPKHHETSFNTVKEKKETTAHNHQTGVKTNDSGSSQNAVQLREKKGRLTTEERREKARSLGDIGNKLHKVEVSIFDPSVPPSRTVDTMDIPDQMENVGKRPMSSNAILETPPLASKSKPYERKSLDAKGVLNRNAFKDQDHVKVNSNVLKTTSTVGEASLNGNSTEHKTAAEKKAALPLEGSSNEGMPAPGPTLEKKAWDLETSKGSSPVKSSRSGSESSFMTDISELSAKLSAAIASPPPQPIRLSMSESNLLSTSSPTGNVRSSIGKDHGKEWLSLRPNFPNLIFVHKIFIKFGENSSIVSKCRIDSPVSPDSRV